MQRSRDGGDEDENGDGDGHKMNARLLEILSSVKEISTQHTLPRKGYVSASVRDANSGRFEEIRRKVQEALKLVQNSKASELMTDPMTTQQPKRKRRRTRRKQQPIKTIPTAVLGLVLGFVGDPIDIAHASLACHALYDATKLATVWSYADFTGVYDPFSFACHLIKRGPVSPTFLRIRLNKIELPLLETFIELSYPNGRDVLKTLSISVESKGLLSIFRPPEECYSLRDEDHAVQIESLQLQFRTIAATGLVGTAVRNQGGAVPPDSRRERIIYDISEAEPSPNNMSFPRGGGLLSRVRVWAPSVQCLTINSSFLRTMALTEMDVTDILQLTLLRSLSITATILTNPPLQRLLEQGALQSLEIKGIRQIPEEDIEFVSATLHKLHLNLSKGIIATKVDCPHLADLHLKICSYATALLCGRSTVSPSMG